jgi:hypothetical protein
MSIASLQAEKAAKEAELVAINDQIERLRAAKADAVGIKEEVGLISNDVKKAANCDGVWLGMEYTGYYSNTTDTFVSTDYSNYLLEIEQGIETIDAKISELNEKAIETGGLISWLAGEISRLIAEAERAARAAAAAAAASQRSPGRGRW